MSEKLEPNQIQAAQMVAKGISTRRITEAVGICADTLYRWKKIPEFMTLVDSLIGGELAETRLRLAHMADASFSTLWELMQHSQNDTARLRAALSVLKLAGIKRISAPDTAETRESEPETEPDKSAPCTDASADPTVWLV